MITPLVAGLGTTELLIILAVLVLLFGATKLPELARGSGRALRIFKSETKGLMDDDDVAADPDRPTPRPRPTEPRELPASQAELDADADAEVERQRRGDTTT